MGRINFFSVLVLFAVFGCYLCQNGAGNANGTTTVAPSNVTTTTTVAPSTTSTTTIKPTPPPTTPAPVPTTTLAPAPVPTIISGNVTEGNYTCLRYEFTVHFNIKYNTTLNETKTALVQLPLNSHLHAPTGTCSSAKESFSLYQGDSLNFTLTFAKNENSVYLDSINLYVVYDNKTFPNVESKNHTYNLVNLSPNFNVEKSHSYLCANVTVPKNGDANVQVVFSSLKLQAFMDKAENGQFSSEHNCQNEINDVVPIAVGAALTGLVVIVLVAYFIGRRRSRRLAYQSV